MPAKKKATVPIKLEHWFNPCAVTGHQMLQAQFLEFDASPADGLLIGIEQVHAAHEGINVFVLNFLSHQGQHVHSPRVTAAQQHDGPLLGSHD